MTGFLKIARSGRGLVTFLALSTMLLASAGCSSDSASPADVTDIQAEMKAQVPKGTETVPPEKATAGIQNAGPSRGGK